MNASMLGTVATLMLAASLIGCGGDNDNDPALCGAVDNLQKSVDAIKSTDVSQSGAINQLDSGLTTVQTDLSDVKSEAGSQFSSQIDTVSKSYSALKTSVDTAKSDPSASNLSEVGIAMSTFGTDVNTLSSDTNC
jgi:capsule polysaccharide export protein KpsE/RkpR